MYLAILFLLPCIVCFDVHKYLIDRFNNDTTIKDSVSITALLNVLHQEDALHEQNQAHGYQDWRLQVVCASGEQCHYDGSGTNEPYLNPCRYADEPNRSSHFYFAVRLNCLNETMLYNEHRFSCPLHLHDEYICVNHGRDPCQPRRIFYDNAHHFDCVDGRRFRLRKEAPWRHESVNVTCPNERCVDPQKFPKKSKYSMDWVVLIYQLSKFIFWIGIITLLVTMFKKVSQHRRPEWYGNGITYFSQPPPLPQQNIAMISPPAYATIPNKPPAYSEDPTQRPVSTGSAVAPPGYVANA